MRGSRWSLIVIISVVIGLGISGCGKKQPAPPPSQPPPAAAPTTPPPPPPPPPPAPPPSPAPLSEEEAFARKSIEDLNREGVIGDVHFDYDESTIRDDAKSMLAKNAEWLKRWTSVRFTIEGHADERGTAEYNLSLGERRANAVKNYLASLGIGANRMALVSLGEERPQCTESTEGCWAKNRRAHSVITGK